MELNEEQSIDIKLTTESVKAQPRSLKTTWGVRHHCGRFARMDGSIAVLLECEAYHDGEQAPLYWSTRLVPSDPPAHLVRFCPEHRDVDVSPFYDEEARAYRVVRIIPVRD